MINGHDEEAKLKGTLKPDVDDKRELRNSRSPSVLPDIAGVGQKKGENHATDRTSEENLDERKSEVSSGMTKEDEELVNIVARRQTNHGNADDKVGDMSLERISRTLAADFCVTPTRSIDTPTRAIEGLNKAVRDSPGLWKSTMDPVVFPELEGSASNFFEMNQLSEQIAATADSMTSEGDIAELLGVASEAEEKMKNERKSEEDKGRD